MTKTQNYNLNKPEVTDPLRVEDFNANADIIDAALNSLNTAVGSKAEQSALAELIVTGTYEGAVSSSSTGKQTVTLGFQPRFLFIRNADYKGSSSIGDDWTPKYLAFATPKHGHYVNGGTKVVSITSTGFTVGGYEGLFNMEDTTYAYLAIR